jgi:predicted transcriptional regulator
MIEALLGSLSCERVLLFICARNEGYAREIARFYETNLAAIQKQLDKLELAGVLVSRTAGRTRLYSFNPRYAFTKELRALLEKAISFLPPDERERLVMVRRRPRRKGKPL